MSGREVHLCIPVLRRYDLLRELLMSLDASTVRPQVHVIDNGRDATRLVRAFDRRFPNADIFTPNRPMGIAESWNWFLLNVVDDRVIVNDDVTFAPESLERLVAPVADLVWAKDCGFSCFVIRDACVEKIGMFDETISPGYGYYEDEDYLQRLDGRGTREPSAIAVTVACGVRHVKSATLKSASHEQVLEHHRKFKIAQGNYIKKYPHVAAEFA